MNSKLQTACALMLALSACGGGNDPTPEVNEAAPANVVNASVARAETELERAEEKVEARQEAEAKGEAAAEATLNQYQSISDEPATGSAAPAAQRPTTVDPSSGARLQTPPVR